MQIMVIDGSLARTRVLLVSRLRLLLGLVVLCVLLILMSGAIYHTILLKAANEGWPIVSQVVRLVVRDDAAQRDRVMRENLDAMAQRVGEMQAKLVKLEAMGERVSGLAGLKPHDLPQDLPQGRQPLQQRPRGAAGGPYLPLAHPSLDDLMRALVGMEAQADQHIDVLTLAESRLFESRLKALMVPSTRPLDGPIGSGFGFRSDPITGLAALHSGLDFPAETGAPIVAAAGGVVLASEVHPQYGQLLEIDHGNGLVTRYAHTSKVLVKPGDLVRRGQVVARVGTTGRSTGPHLHFEVLVDNVPQNPAKFLDLPAVPPLAAGLQPPALIAR